MPTHVSLAGRFKAGVTEIDEFVAGRNLGFALSLEFPFFFLREKTECEFKFLDNFTLVRALIWGGR